MDLPAALFPAWLLWSSMLLAGLLLGFACSRVRWRQLDGTACNAWMGAVVLELGLWLMKGGFKPGLSFHLLGCTVFTLLMGPWLALLAVALLLLALVAGGHGDLLALGLNLLLMGAVPVLLSGLLLRLARGFLPAQLFVYVFVNAFVAGGLGLFLSSLGSVLTLGLSGKYGWEYLLDEALPFYFLLSWSEAFTSGLVIAILIVYRPRWVSTFDDVLYLGPGPGLDD